MNFLLILVYTNPNCPIDEFADVWTGNSNLPIVEATILDVNFGWLCKSSMNETFNVDFYSLFSIYFSMLIQCVILFLPLKTLVFMAILNHPLDKLFLQFEEIILSHAN